MSEVSISLSASASSFQSAENTINISSDEAGNSNTSSTEVLTDDFLKYDNLPDAIAKVEPENEELSSELRQLMSENIPVPDITTPLEEKNVEDSLSEIKINNSDNFWLTKEWQNKERHVFILSSSGKPVYSRYGCEDKLATLFGVMQALVSFVQDTDDDSIQSIKAGDMYFSFLSKGYLIVVSVCHHRHSDQSLLQQQLLYIYNQIISTLTLSQLTKIFDMHRNFDLRRLLSGSERLIHTLIDFTETQVDFVLSSYRCLALSSGTRDQISAVLASACAKVKNLVFVILIGSNRIISYLHMKKYNLRPMDIHLILNLVQSSESFKTAEIWTPLCLPQFDASGYLYSHVSYLADDCPACLLMLTVDKNLFFTLSEAKKVVTEKLRRGKLLDEINTALSSPPLLTSKLNITSLRHFVYRCKQTNQLICPQYEAPYYVPTADVSLKSQNASNSDGASSTMSDYSVASSPPSRREPCSKAVLEYYAHLYCDIHRQSRHLKLYYQTTDTETLLGWTTTGFELYLIFEPLISKPSATNAVNKLLRWIKKEEDKLFMLNNYTL